MKEIILAGGETTLVDEVDYEELARYRWRRDYDGYVTRNDKRNHTQKTLFMHRVVMKAPVGVHVDHKNGNQLDNRRANLRLATSSENIANSRPQVGRSSRFKGVSWKKETSKWVAYIKHQYKYYHLGSFSTELLAAATYDEAARKFFGKFAWTNFPERVAP